MMNLGCTLLNADGLPGFVLCFVYTVKIVGITY